MPDRDKVIKGMEMHASGLCNVLTTNGKEYCPYWENNDNCMVQLLKDALSLLKAQEPVKPFVTGNGHTFEEAETWWYECGNCNEPIDSNDQYCRHCGRAVKWDEPPKEET